MARGKPDFSTPDYYNASTTVDVGEIASVLKGVGKIDGMGRIIYFDDFQGTKIRWELDYNVPAKLPVYSTQVAEIGDQSLFLQPGATEASEYSCVYRDFVLGSLSSFGVQFSLYGALISRSADIEIEVYTGTHYSYNELLIDQYNHKIQLYHYGGYTTLVEPFAPSNFYGWLPIKLTLDPVNLYYKRLSLGAKMFDLSTYKMRRGIQERVVPTIRVTFNGFGPGSDKLGLYLGHFIMTLDEP